jgi:hypothetical protein
MQAFPQHLAHASQQPSSLAHRIPRGSFGFEAEHDYRPSLHGFVCGRHLYADILSFSAHAVSLRLEAWMASGVGFTAPNIYDAAVASLGAQLGTIARLSRRASWMYAERHRQNLEGEGLERNAGSRLSRLKIALLPLVPYGHPCGELSSPARYTESVFGIQVWGCSPSTR